MRKDNEDYWSWLERECVSAYPRKTLGQRLFLWTVYKLRSLEYARAAKRYKRGIVRESDLVYSAGARCRCGAGLAYPLGIGPGGHWSCSNVLLRRVDVPADHDEYSFVFYEIKSESQPSVRGLTTRPKVAKVIHTALSHHPKFIYSPRLK